MTAVAFNGLVSGIDTASLVTGLVNAEKAAANPYLTQQANLNGQKSIVGNLTTALSALGSLATTMKPGSTELTPHTATVSDAHLTVAVSSSAIPTTHDIRVKQTAQAQITASRTFTSDGAGVLGGGSVTIGASTITYGNTDTLAGIASKINDAKAGVSASVLNDGTTFRLILTATASGTAGAVTMADTGDSLGLGDPANIKIPARNSILSIDGVDVTRSTNVIDDAISGVTITAVSAHAVADPDAQVHVALDADGVSKKLTALVNSYNVIAAGLNGQLSYTGDGTTRKGADTLFGDSTLRQLQGRLTTLMTSTFGGHNLSEIGLSRDKDGILSLDATKLTTALAKDSTIVSTIMTSGGFADKLSKMTDDYDRAGDGILAGKTAALTSQSKLLQSQVDQINAHAETMKAQLEEQFSKLESMLSNMKSQSSYLTRVLG